MSQHKDVGDCYEKRVIQRNFKMLRHILKSALIATYLYNKLFYYLQGMLRLYADMPEICVDVPIAYTLLDRFAAKLNEVGLLEGAVGKELPSRFVEFQSKNLSVIINPFWVSTSTRHITT